MSRQLLRRLSERQYCWVECQLNGTWRAVGSALSEQAVPAHLIVTHEVTNVGHDRTQLSPMLRSHLSPLMAMTYRQSHLRATSGLPPGADIQKLMSVFVLISSGSPPRADVADPPRERGVMTHNGHLLVLRLRPIV